MNYRQCPELLVKLIQTTIQGSNLKFFDYGKKVYLKGENI